MKIHPRKSRPIGEIRNAHHREWLLIAVDEMDEATTTPLTGTLLAHSPRRDEAYLAARRYRRPTYLVFSEDSLPPGYVAAFRAHA